MFKNLNFKYLETAIEGLKIETTKKNEDIPAASELDVQAEKTTEINKAETLMKVPTEISTDAELDVTSEQFNPLRALYATDYKVTKKKPKVLYQNLVAFENAFKKFGILKLNTPQIQKPPQLKQTKLSDAADSNLDKAPTTSIYIDEDSEMKRRFLPHQMAVKRTTLDKQRHHRNLILQMSTEATGPLARLYQCLQQHERISVAVRSEHGVRGLVEGNLLFFDKHWNLLLSSVTEIWKRRKYKYGENKFCGVPENCERQLRKLGIVLPQQQVQSLNRKNVEIRREVPQLLVRGEQVVKITVLSGTQKDQSSTV